MSVLRYFFLSNLSQLLFSIDFIAIGISSIAMYFAAERLFGFEISNFTAYIYFNMITAIVCAVPEKTCAMADMAYDKERSLLTGLFTAKGSTTQILNFILKIAFIAIYFKNGENLESIIPYWPLFIILLLAVSFLFVFLLLILCSKKEPNKKETSESTQENYVPPSSTFTSTSTTQDMESHGDSSTYSNSTLTSSSSENTADQDPKYGVHRNLCIPFFLFYGIVLYLLVYIIPLLPNNVKE